MNKELNINLDSFKALFDNFSIKEGKVFTYGTAGFREKSDILDSVMFAVGVVSVLRSAKLGGKIIGVMITASHNPPQDNGVKIVDPQGEMLANEWEVYATKLSNFNKAEESFAYIKNLISELNINLQSKPLVVFAKDTRESGPRLVKSLVAGINSIGGSYEDFGDLTTPQLHYIVRCKNTQNDPALCYGEPSEEGYYKKLAKSFKKLITNNANSTLTVDCANGIGALKLKKFCEVVGNVLSTEIVNGDTQNHNKLNHNCGADFVKVNHKFPDNVELPSKEKRYCSFDGDADRIVYYYYDDESRTLRLLDGDKISALASMFLVDLLKRSNIEEIGIGTVQTAYANGSSTQYLKNHLKVPVSCVQTGVKHLHHEAEKYDIGVYFEANGHGTIVFGSSAVEKINKKECQTPAETESINQLKAFIELTNQTVGDAISDMLIVEVILNQKQWSLKTWDEQYTDLPNRLMKVTVSDRTIFKTTNADTRLTEPSGIQAKIDQIVSKYSQGRSFVRPSGTEDVVRIYAEADTRVECDDLAYNIATLIYSEGNGTGPQPQKFTY